MEREKEGRNKAKTEINIRWSDAVHHLSVLCPKCTPVYRRNREQHIVVDRRHTVVVLELWLLPGFSLSINAAHLQQKRNFFLCSCLQLSLLESL